MVHGRYGYTQGIYAVKFLELDRVDVVHKLVENIVDIEFIKEKDIQLRKMRCTLMDTEIPDDKMPKSEMLWNYQNSDKVIKVFDLDLQQWSSIPSRERDTI